MSVTITNISRTSFHDGPGIRTVIYFNGCKMACVWCHNPETISPETEIVYVKDKCVHCGRCISLCQNHIVVENQMEFLRENCKKCGECAKNCPSNALSVCGEEYTPESLLKEVLKDRLYFEQSGGGVTLSGGECLLQPEFAKELLRLCKEENIHTLIETAAFVPYKNIEAVLPFTDAFYIDLKIANEQKHKQYTKVSNALIIENISKLSKVHNNITLRIPLIPTVNDTVEEMAEFAKIINTFENIKGIELLGYNYLARGKYINLGKTYVSFGEESQTKETKTLLANTLKENLLTSTEVYFR